MPHRIDHAALVERVAARRGGMRRTFDKFDPARNAHFIIDMQNGFLEEVAPVEVPEARTIVDNVNRLSRAIRDAGGTNVFLRYTTSDLDGEWSVFGRRMGAELTPRHKAAFMPGAHYHQFWPALDVAPEDLVIDKGRFSGLCAGASTMHADLQARGIDTLLITGTLTNCCCETTARDAMQLNYRVNMVTDANAALSDAEHEMTLFTLGFIFADLFTTDEVVAELAAQRAVEPA
jgi:ureidoacrylate peracid hydrolase